MHIGKKLKNSLVELCWPTNQVHLWGESCIAVSECRCEKSSGRVAWELVFVNERTKVLFVIGSARERIFCPDLRVWFSDVDLRMMNFRKQARKKQPYSGAILNVPTDKGKVTSDPFVGNKRRLRSGDCFSGS